MDAHWRINRCRLRYCRCRHRHCRSNATIRCSRMDFNTLNSMCRHCRMNDTIRYSRNVSIILLCTCGQCRISTSRMGCTLRHSRNDNRLISTLCVNRRVNNICCRHRRRGHSCRDPRGRHRHGMLRWQRRGARRWRSRCRARSRKVLTGRRGGNLPRYARLRRCTIIPVHGTLNRSNNCHGHIIVRACMRRCGKIGPRRAWARCHARARSERITTARRRRRPRMPIT